MVRAALVLLILGSAAKPASADWLLTPYVGVVFGGSANNFNVNDLSDEFEQRLSFGGGLTWMGKGMVGLEVDYHLAPNFYQITGGDRDIELLNLDSSVQTLMANFVLGAPLGGTSGIGVRPYGVAGIGLMRATLSGADQLFNNLSNNELGVNVGGGVHVFFSDNIGLRGDARYFRALEKGDDGGRDLDLEDFDFWRATLGVTFRFGG
ncbi:MAG: outer membrane beta-barrel protein [Acidobacteriota bacterium]|nr:outer membrane beta-barrel protein [Acidobacteriota bacterium]